MRRNKTYGCTDRTCGAPDCECCYPGSNSPVTCERCDFTCAAYDSDDYFHEYCGSLYCKQCLNVFIDESLAEAHGCMLELREICDLSDTEKEIVTLLEKWYKESN